MSNILYNFTSIQGIIAKVSLVLFQANREVVKQDLIYRGEGNANIVISIPEKRQILRIQKTEQPQTLLLWLIDWIVNVLNLNERCRIKNDCQDLNFYKNVMMPLLGGFVCEATPVFVSRKQTSDLSKAITQSRPNFRKHKKLQFGRATFFTDYAFLPKSLDSNKLIGATFAVEIKPKQGWIPLQSRQCPKCQFCQNQYLKLEQGQIKKISDYCPLDLFSGCKIRMTKAIRSLIHNPQNNFKIFRNGIYSYGDNVDVNTFYDLIREWFQYDEDTSTDSLSDQFYDLVYDVLVKRTENQPTNHECPHFNYTDLKNSTEHKAGGCAYTESTLPNGSVLEKILLIQKFDQLGIETYHKLYKEIGPDRSSDFTYVEKLLKEVNKSKCPKCAIMGHVQKNLDYVRGECGRQDISELELMPYLIASVVNDCSLMITCRRIRESDQIVPDEHVLNTRSGRYVVSVGVFDLYPKPMSTIEKHIKRKIKIQKACNRSR